MCNILVNEYKYIFIIYSFLFHLNLNLVKILLKIYFINLLFQELCKFEGKFVFRQQNRLSVIFIQTLFSNIVSAFLSLLLTELLPKM